MDTLSVTLLLCERWKQKICITWSQARTPNAVTSSSSSKNATEQNKTKNLLFWNFVVDKNVLKKMIQSYIILKHW